MAGKWEKTIKYIKDVYNVEEGLRNLQDERINPTYKTDKIVLSVLFGFILRISGLLSRKRTD